MESTVSKDREGLCFFGQISATVSHDLKNVLAIINEDAGLLQDFSLMAAQGMELDPARLLKLAEKIQSQIKRGDSIIINMNRFAHSVDLPECEVDFHELVSLVVSLLTRMASRKCVKITLDESGPVKGKGDPFSIQMLIAGCLEKAMDWAGRDSVLNIETAKEADNCAIKISGINNAIPEDQLPDLERLAGSIGASLEVKPDEHVLIMKF